MALRKIATLSNRCPIKALNRPSGKGWEIYNFPNQIKTASINIDGEDLGGFDLKEATKEHPDHLYIKIFAIKKDEPNDNGDSFNERELKKAAPTFVGVPLFTNHQNDDVEKARGECVHSWYDSEEGGIFIIGKVDKIAYPKLARGIEEGYISGTSMGCSVEYSLCSVCHNMAHTSDEYCSHVSNRKNRKYSGDIKCAYHQSKADTEEKCPICGSTKDDVQTLKHADQQIFEHNFGLKFIENSFVVNPACHSCGVTSVLHIPELQKKVAAFRASVDNLVKYADEDEKFMQKIGGVQELNALKSSMNEMETVVKSMLKQKDNVSMEYVSDLVKAMADVQGIFDELIEMGYAALPSPPVTAETENEPMETFPEPIPEPEPQMAATPSGASVEDLGGLGNVTLPKKSSKNKEDFSKISERVISKVESLQKDISSLREKYNNTNKNEIGAIMATNNTTKTAAGADNLEAITEKQLLKKEEKLHPQTDQVYEGITESKEQIGGSERSNDTTSDSPQVRKGTYETITEDQLKTESALGSAVIHFVDYPDVITEKQWNDFSRDVAGDLPDDYTEQITQAQIRELLSKHKFIGDIETITEDQLRSMSMTDGLKRWANQDYSVTLLKTAVDTITDAIVNYRKSPQEIAKSASIIHDDNATKTKAAFLSIVNSLPSKKEEREALAKNSGYFNKTASYSSIATIDALIMAAAGNGKFNMRAEDLFDSIYHVAKNKEMMAKIDKKVKERLASPDGDTIITQADAFEQAAKVLDRPEDGRYQIKATLEDIGVPITDRKAFVEGVKKFAQEMIDDDGVAAAVIRISVGDNGELIIDIQDGAEDSIGADDIGDIIEGPVEDIPADINGGEEVEEEDHDCSSRKPRPDEKPCSSFDDDDDDDDTFAAAKKEIKQAQMMGGEMGGQGGVSQAPGAGASLPPAPGMDTPPMENFTEDPLADEEGGFEDDNKEPKPPGSMCPVCGSDDVDIISGKGKCNNCSSEMVFKIKVDVTKWQGVTPSGDEAGEEGEEIGAGEGFELPTEEEMGGMGGMGAMGPEEEMPAMAAYTRLLPEALKKIGSQGIALGSVSPASGTTNTIDLGDGYHMCMDTGTRYKVSCIVSTDGKQAYSQWEWTPKVAGVNCPSCHRAKARFVKALKSVKMDEDGFDKLSLKDKIETIVKLNKSGALKKTASKTGSVLEDYKVAYGNYGDKFPVESCIEKLSRRFGKDAVCLSGPDEGKNLAESVCNRLKKADVYTDGIAVKVAAIWSDNDGDEDCITDQVRSGYSLREAADVCGTLKEAVAQPHYLFADELATAQIVDEVPIEEPVDEAPVDDVDPFESIDEGIDDGMGGGTVTLELPADVAQQLEEAVDRAIGEPADEVPGEGLPGEGLPGEEAPIEEVTPEDLGEETKPMDMGGDMKPMEGGEMKPMEGGEMKPMEGGDVQPCTEFEQDLPEGVAPTPKKVQVNVDPNLQASNKKEELEKEAGKEEENEDYDYKEALNMSGSMGKVGKPQMDLSSVAEVLSKMASEKEISQEKAQDSSDIGTYTAGEGGSLMGHENETIRTPQKPSVPRDNATMGQEPSDLNPQDKPQPVIPSGDAAMGHEREVGLMDVVDDRYTGGDKGQGKTELASADDDLYHMKGFRSSKDGLSSLADRIAKKLAPKEPVAKDKDIQPISDGGTIGKEEKFTADDPTNTEGSATESLIGHEGETVGDAPKSPADHPEVYTGNAQQGQEDLDSEKTTKDKGTVIAKNDSESEAYRVAARMLQANKIEVSELQTKVNELKDYKPAQIRDIEKGIFAGQKGLDTVSDGMSQAVQINEASSMRNANDELSNKLQELFTLGKQNKMAEEDPTTQLRKVFK